MLPMISWLSTDNLTEFYLLDILKLEDSQKVLLGGNKYPLSMNCSYLKTFLWSLYFSLTSIKGVWFYLQSRGLQNRRDRIKQGEGWCAWGCAFSQFSEHVHKKWDLKFLMWHQGFYRWQEAFACITWNLFVM